MALGSVASSHRRSIGIGIPYGLEMGNQTHMSTGRRQTKKHDRQLTAVHEAGHGVLGIVYYDEPQLLTIRSGKNRRGLHVGGAGER